MQRLCLTLLAAFFSLAGAAQPTDPYLATALQIAQQAEPTKTTSLSIGAWLERRGRHVYVRDFYHGSPAQKAGLVRGDQILAVDGKESGIIDALLQLPHGKSVTLTYKRLPWSSPTKVQIKPVPENLREAWLASTRQSVSWEQVDDHQLAYFRIWTVTDRSMISTAASTFASLVRKKPAAIIADLRGPMPYDDASLCQAMQVAFPPKAESKVIVVTDRHSGPCRLQLAAAWRKAWGARIIGERGALEPDVPTQDQLLFAAGHDPLMRRAQEFATEWIRQ